MSEVEVYISQKELSDRLDSLAKEIASEFKGEEIVMIGVLNGAFIFCADLVRRIDLPIKVEFIVASSYNGETDSSGKLDILLDLRSSIEGKNVLLVDDIVDTGLTLTHIKEMLLKRNPKKLKTAALLFKKERMKHRVDLDFCGFHIEDYFVIGNGLDYKGRMRNLPYIGVFK